MSDLEKMTEEVLVDTSGTASTKDVSLVSRIRCGRSLEMGAIQVGTRTCTFPTSEANIGPGAKNKVVGM